MVPVRNAAHYGVDPQNASLSNNNLPLLASSSIAKDKLFPIPTWAPRSGRTAMFDEWRRGITLLCNAFGITTEQLYAHAPIPPKPTSQVVTRQEEAKFQAAVNEYAQWVTIDTALYWHVLPSLDLRGVNMERDRARTDAYTEGRTACGRALIAHRMG